MTNLTSDLKIGTKIGQGHFGEVYLGDDPVHGRVAVKRLQKGPTESDTDWSERKNLLLREAQHLKRAAHRNVLQVHHLVEDKTEDSILMVTNFCSGGSLQKPFENGPMKLTDLRRVFTEITQGLQALHARGMLHRDIKPGNILIDQNGTVQLGDFGLVTDRLILGYGSQAGYMDHIAPEVYQEGGTSFKTDIWALGVTIFRLAHGSEWYSSLPRPSRLVPQGGFANRLRWLPHVPNNWRRIVRRMLRDDTSLRYQTAMEVFADLSKLPALNDWNCEVSSSEVKWQRLTSTRKVLVRWIKHSDRRHEWTAASPRTGKNPSKAPPHGSSSPTSDSSPDGSQGIAMSRRVLSQTLKESDNLS